MTSKQSEQKYIEESAGVLVSENKLAEWESKVHNYLFTILDMENISLSYVIRKIKIQYRTRLFPDFIDDTVSINPIHRVSCHVNRATIHQKLILSIPDQLLED